MRCINVVSQAVNVAMIALNSFETVQKAFVMAKEDLSEILSGKIRKTFICFYMY